MRTHNFVSGGQRRCAFDNHPYELSAIAPLCVIPRRASLSVIVGMHRVQPLYLDGHFNGGVAVTVNAQDRLVIRAASLVLPVEAALAGADCA